MSVIYHVEGCRGVNIRYTIYWGNNSAEYIFEFVMGTSKGCNSCYIYSCVEICEQYFNLLKSSKLHAFFIIAFESKLPVM